MQELMTFKEPLRRRIHITLIFLIEDYAEVLDLLV